MSTFLQLIIESRILIIGQIYPILIYSIQFISHLYLGIQWIDKRWKKYFYISGVGGQRNPVDGMKWFIFSKEDTFIFNFHICNDRRKLYLIRWRDTTRLNMYKTTMPTYIQPSLPVLAYRSVSEYINPYIPIRSGIIHTYFLINIILEYLFVSYDPHIVFISK